MTASSHTPIRRPRAPLFMLRREQVVPASRATVFSFFANAHNLDRLTPSYLRFRILSWKPVSMQVGTRIEYAIRLHGFPMRWVSEITVWDPPVRFVDMQIRGPYRWWHHEHRFEDLGDSTNVVDEVEYSCPGGRLVHALFVKRDLKRIFDFRKENLEAVFADETDTREPLVSTGQS